MIYHFNFNLNHLKTRLLASRILFFTPGGMFRSICPGFINRCCLVNKDDLSIDCSVIVFLCGLLAVYGGVCIFSIGEIYERLAVLKATLT